ncbi:uncharacterized protein [Parasteatoda tepidariorum]|uniref:uncharacterized protein isoform X2 n=1 Tax=Parasteatoda tepidariorum TaxID=114398 RepID=UPI0039BD0415
MLSDKFTFLELLDLALGIPEDGTNFNILHTVLTQLVIRLNLHSVKLPCQIENEVAARSAIMKRRKDYPDTLLRHSLSLIPLQKEEKVITKESMKDIEIKATESAPTPKPEPLPEFSESIQLEKAEPQKLEEDSSTESESLPESGKSAEVERLDSRKEAEEDTAESELLPESGQSGQVEKADTLKEAEEITKESESLPESSKSAQVEKADTPKEAEEITKESESLPESGKSAQVEKADPRKVAEEILELTKDPEVPTLTEQRLFEDEPAKVIQEMWRATDINRRMGGAERILGQYADMLDDLSLRVTILEDSVTKLQAEDNQELIDRIGKCEENCNTMNSRLDQTVLETDEKIENVKDSLEDVNRLQEETDSALKDLTKKHEELVEIIAYQKDLEELNELMSDRLTEKEKELKIRILEVEDLITPKEDIAEIVSRVDNLNEIKVNREDLGQLMEPGFIEKLIAEQKNLRIDVEELKISESDLEEGLNNLIKRIDEEILKSIDESFTDVRSTLEIMGMKLDLLDADDINDSFARLEEQIDILTEKQSDLKSSTEQFEKEARTKFKIIVDLKDAIVRLELTKVDKAKLSELLESKADIEMVSNKLDRNEFVAAIREVKDDLKHLTIVVKVNEEEMDTSFKKVRHELSLKMYTEDFITATEPIRNRIKAILYEQERIKEIALAHLLPDAPGVLK